MESPIAQGSANAEMVFVRIRRKARLWSLAGAAMVVSLVGVLLAFPDVERAIPVLGILVLLLPLWIAFATTMTFAVKLKRVIILLVCLLPLYVTACLVTLSDTLRDFVSDIGHVGAQPDAALWPGLGDLLHQQPEFVFRVLSLIATVLGFAILFSDSRSPSNQPMTATPNQALERTDSAE